MDPTLSPEETRPDWKIYLPSALIIVAIVLITCCVIVIIARRWRESNARDVDGPVITYVDGSLQVVQRQRPVTHQNPRFNNNVGQEITNTAHSIQNISPHGFQSPSPAGFSSSPHPPGFQNCPYPPAGFQVPSATLEPYSLPFMENISSGDLPPSYSQAQQIAGFSSSPSNAYGIVVPPKDPKIP